MKNDFDSYIISVDEFGYVLSYIPKINRHIF